MNSIEDIILKKKYSELSSEEKTLVFDLVENEKDYEEIQQLFKNLTNFSSLPDVNPTIKNNLDISFQKKFAFHQMEMSVASSKAKIIPFYTTSQFRWAASFALLIGLGASLYFFNSDLSIVKPQTAQLVKKTVNKESKKSLTAQRNSKNTDERKEIVNEIGNQLENVPISAEERKGLNAISDDSSPALKEYITESSLAPIEKETYQFTLNNRVENEKREIWSTNSKTAGLFGLGGSSFKSREGISEVVVSQKLNNSEPERKDNIQSDLLNVLTAAF